MDHGLFLKTLHRTIKVNQNASLKFIYWYEYWSKKKILTKIFDLSWWIVQFLEKLRKMWVKKIY